MESTHVKRLLFLISAMFLLVTFGRAQSNMVFYNSNDQINAPNLNPAFLMSQGKFTLSFFPVSGLSVGYNNQQVINDMLFNVIQGKSTDKKFNEVFRSMLGFDLFYQRLEMPILSFGYNSKWGSFNFRIKDNMRLMTKLKGDVSDFLSNSTTLAIELNKAQEFPVHAMYYREYSIGYAKEIIRNKLSIGVRVKAYFGKFSLISDVSGDAYLDTDNNYYFRTYNQMKMSFPAKIILDADNYLNSVTTSDNFSFGSFMFNSKNTGVGFDLGFDYQINPDLSFSASVVDVGQIHWKSDLNSMEYVGKDLFDPQYVNIAESDNKHLTRTQNFPASTEQIPSLFKVVMNPAPYSTPMPVSMYAGLKYRVNKKLQIGAVDRYIQVGNMAYNSFSITGDIKMNSTFRLITGLGSQGSSLFNIPLAFLKTWNAGQLFIGTDNILALATKKSYLAGISFGATIFLFTKHSGRKMQIDYLPFFELKKKRIM